MPNGYLRLQLMSAQDAKPVEEAVIRIYQDKDFQEKKKKILNFIHPRRIQHLVIGFLANYEIMEAKRKKKRKAKPS